MPVVITDFTNKTWAVENPEDDYLHVGYSGQAGPRLLDVLDFISTRGKQFEKFVQKRKELEAEEDAKRRKARSAANKRREL